MTFPSLTGLARQPRRLFRWLVVGGLLALAVLDAVLWLTYRTPAGSIRIELRSTVVSQIQLFYDTGQGMSEARSVARSLTAEPGMQTVLFPLPTSPVKLLRVDPLNSPGSVVIRSVSVVRDRDGRVVRSFEVESLEPTHDIVGFERRGRAGN